METKEYKCPFCGEMIKVGNGHHIKKCVERFVENMSEERKQEILKMYDDGASMLDMSKFLGCSYSSTERIMNELGRKRRTIKEATNMTQRKEKYKQTMLNNWGTPHNFDKNNPSRIAWEKRLFEEEGITNVFQREDVKQKIKETFHERYTDEEIYYNHAKGSNLQYWIEKLGEEEGIKKYNEICNNKSKSGRLEYWIDKYGEEEGTELFQKRFKHRYYDGLNNKCAELLDKNNIEYEREFKIFKNNGYFAYDFKIGNLLIELNGMYWHCSPKLYNAEDIVKFPNNLLIKAKDKWEYDARKRQFAIEHGYMIETIWEDELSEEKLLEVLNKYQYGKNS